MPVDLPSHSADVIGDTFTNFADVIDGSRYRPVDANASLAIADVVNSTGALANGRYKAVNMAGAAVVSGVMNALGRRDFAFVFGGDGATLVVDAADVAKVGAALAATQVWAREALDLELRVALVPLSQIRANGFDVKVAWFGASDKIAYAMLSGGGVAWAEAEMKAGRATLPKAPAGSTPDLTGLSCRWGPLPKQQDVVLSLIVKQRPGASDRAFAQAIGPLLALIGERETAHGSPVPKRGPGFRWPAPGLDLEARASQGSGPLWVRKAGLLLETLLAYALLSVGLRVGSFDPAHYRQQTGLNTDFRKFDDGLRMTIDCKTETMAAIEALLEREHAGGTIDYGTHRQDEAMMTCIVPSVLSDDHMHFVDGAGGGYAMAAQALKARSLSRTRA